MPHSSASLLAPARVAIALSTIGALFAHAWLSPDTSGLRFSILAALSLGALGGRFRPRATQVVVLALGHVWPALVFLAVADVDPHAIVVWLAGLTGLMLATSPLARWSLPAGWQVPVASWGLVLALGWPLVLWRELDFTLATYAQADVVNGLFSGPVRYAAGMATATTAAQLSALLFFDWLWTRYDGNTTEAFLREVVLPITIGTVVSLCVGVYQGVFDISWLSVGVWPRLGRAAGTFFDANAFGAMAAVWGALVGGMALFHAHRSVRAAGLILIGLSGAAVWASGSRTALVGWCVIVFGAAVAQAGQARLSRRALALSAAGLLPLVVLAATSGGPGTAIQRFWTSMPTPSAQGVSLFARTMWERDGYGVASAQAIREFPVVGVGPGAFQIVGPDYAQLTLGRVIPPDNAQNWWRHHVAELGLLGSIGPVICSLLVAATLVALVRQGARDPRAYILAAALMSFGLMAMVGPPTAHPIVLQTAAVVLFWATWASTPGARAAFTLAISPILVLVAVWILPVAWAGLTWRAAVLDLRPPYRAVHAGWIYGYGFSAPEMTDGGERRWAAPRAVGVVPALRSRLVLTLEPPHEDISDRPVRVRVSDRYRELADTRRSTREPFTCVVTVAPGERWVMVQIETDRAWTVEDGMARAMRVTARFE